MLVAALGAGRDQRQPFQIHAAVVAHPALARADRPSEGQLGRPPPRHPPGGSGQPPQSQGALRPRGSNGAHVRGSRC
jgi:hypothetical protein